MDKIIYCSDLEALKAKLKADGHYDEESGAYTVNHTLTPLKYKDNISLSYVRNFALSIEDKTDFEGNVIEGYWMLEDLGTYQSIMNDAEKLAKYKSVYDYEATYTDEDGNTYGVPFKIGGFC